MNPLLRFNSLFQSLIRPYPGRDWFLTLAALALVLILFVSYDGYLFFGIQSGSLFEPVGVSGASLPAVTRGDITTVLEIYHTKKTNYENHNLPLPPLDDPIEEFDPSQQKATPAPGK